MNSFECPDPPCNIGRPHGIVIHRGHWAVTIFRYGYAEAWESKECCRLSSDEYIHYLFGPYEQYAIAYADFINRRN